jgi:CheY-like chemotaxis protein
MSEAASKTATLLLIEDDEVDAAALKRALEAGKIGNPLIIAGSAEEALHILRTGSPEAHHDEGPYLILLDLSLPGMSGLDFLRELRNDPKRRNTTVLVTTGSEEKQDEAAAKALGVYAYIRKSQCCDDLLEVLRRLQASLSLVER